MFSNKKPLLLLMFYFAVLNTTAKSYLVADTSVKILVVNLNQISPKPFSIDIAVKSGSFKISYIIANDINYESLFNDPASLEPTQRPFIPAYIALGIKHSVARRDSLETTDVTLKHAVDQLIKVNAEGRERITIYNSPSVLDGATSYFEIITPLATKRIAARAISEENDPILYHVLKQCLDIYSQKHPGAMSRGK